MRGGAAPAAAVAPVAAAALGSGALVPVAAAGAPVAACGPALLLGMLLLPLPGPLAVGLELEGAAAVGAVEG